jgi:ArsR family transcriptional regulator
VGLALGAERDAVRPVVRRRLRRLAEDPPVRARYLDVLRRVWSTAEPVWRKHGRAAADSARTEWERRLAAGTPVEELVSGRHPLLRTELGLEPVLANRAEFAVSPMYFCMSGGHVVDLDEYVQIGVPASDRHPVRKVRDAMFVANRMRVFGDPTRVLVLIQLTSAPATVTELAQVLRLPQASVSDHIKVLREAGVLEIRRQGRRTSYAVLPRRVDRVLAQARATLAIWE